MPKKNKQRVAIFVFLARSTRKLGAKRLREHEVRVFEFEEESRWGAGSHNTEGSKGETGMEQKINHIYSKTYNYVYLRAKSILRREEDVLQLMRDVYTKLLENPDMMEPEKVYEWLGKNVYAIGSAHYRKRKVREDECLELQEQDLIAPDDMDLEDSVDIIEEHLGDLPDLYHAMMYAFYYDYMTIEGIAELMECTTGNVVNALNYTKKYMIKALENYHDETKVRVAFSAEAMRGALRKWSVENCLGLTVAQSVYSDICKSADIQATALAVEGKEFAGVNHTVVYHEADDWELTREQLKEYGNRRVSKKRLIEVLAKGGAVVVVLIVLALIGIVINRSLKKDDEPSPNPIQNEQEKEEEEETIEDTQQDETEELEDEYVLPESSIRPLTRSDLEGLTREELRLARNEIFARYGVIFGVEDLHNYFSQQSWYVPRMTLDEFQANTEISMSAIEEDNIQFIIAREEELRE